MSKVKTVLVRLKFSLILLLLSSTTLVGCYRVPTPGGIDYQQADGKVLTVGEDNANVRD